MDRLLAGLFGLLLIASVGSHAARAPDQYWKSALPDTPMPSSLSQLLNTPAGGTTVNVGGGGVHVDAGHGKPGSTTVNVGKGGVGVNVNPGSGKPGGTTVGVGKGGVGVNVKPGNGKPGGTTVGVNVNPGYGKPGGTTVGVGKGGVGVNVNPGKPGGTTVGVGKGGVGVNVNPGKPGGTTVGVGKGGVGVGVNPGYGKPGGTTVGVGKGGVGVNVKPRGKPVHVNVSPFLYNYAATETQLHDDPSVALFFQEKDLHAGKKVTVQFTNTEGAAGAKFLPRSEAEAIPFSSEKVPEILTRFSVRPDSVEAAEMEQTLRDCEAPAAEGERKACATSLESMVDFATSSLGTSRVRAVSTVVAKPGSPKQEYTVTGATAAGGDGDGRLVACHAEPYAYAVFACHLTRRTRAYSVSMVGRDGTAVDAVAVCHADTSGWNPKHVAFQVLGVEPGTAPVCHFLPQDHVVWTRSG
ncbi:unnamed protein product [Urochloa decumbens]|uniref:BURP domain-containing protein n=1 Tax=Urochloa decumbens TaxID=240449 RepID=A0ABC9A9R7_9POAL